MAVCLLLRVQSGNLNRTKLGTKIQIHVKFRDLVLIFKTERNLNKKSYCLKSFCEHAVVKKNSKFDSV